MVFSIRALSKVPAQMAPPLPASASFPTNVHWTSAGLPPHMQNPPPARATFPSKVHWKKVAPESMSQ